MAAKRKLSLVDVFCTATGAMISSGLFILPGLAYAATGPSAIVSYFLAGLIALTGMLCQAELVSAMPKTGGTYFYVTRSMGPAVGAVNGLITWFSLSLKSTFALVGMAAFTRIVLPGLDIRLIGLCLCALFVCINILGIKEAGRLQVALVLTLIGCLVAYVGLGLRHVDVVRFTPFTPHGAGATIATAGMVFVSYGGLLKVAAIAEEVENPARTIPRAMILSLGLVSILYTLVVFVTCGVLDGTVLANSMTPITGGAGSFMRGGGALVMSIGAILAFVSTANAGIMAASRYPVALARDDLLPRRFARTNERFGTPHVGILVTGCFIVASLFLNLEVLVKAASSVLILSFLLSCLSVIIMRESHVQNYRPQFKAPFYPWLQIGGALLFLMLLGMMGTSALLVTAALVGGGLATYWLYGRIRATREYALLHLIERITARELTANLLESELKEIVRERDDLVMDRFDRLVDACEILDFDHAITAAELFEAVSEQFAGHFGIAPAAFTKLLNAREEENSTVLGDGLAIPHIVVEGDHAFDILLARCRDGITFPGTEEKVQAVFVLAGSRDERNFHLKALSSIAQIVQDADFRKRWLAARDERGLKDVLLLGQRMRS